MLTATTLGSLHPTRHVLLQHPQFKLFPTTFITNQRRLLILLFLSSSFIEHLLLPLILLSIYPCVDLKQKSSPLPLPTTVIVSLFLITVNTFAKLKTEFLKLPLFIRPVSTLNSTPYSAAPELYSSCCEESLLIDGQFNVISFLSLHRPPRVYRSRRGSVGDAKKRRRTHSPDILSHVRS